MRISDIITQRILTLLEESAQGMAEIQRNELAALLGCVPSQINYVLSSRFTPEQGYIVESRRGGGGYIRITRVDASGSAALMHVLNYVGDSLDSGTARLFVDNLLHQGLISAQAAALMDAALSDKCYRDIRPEGRDSLRAAIFKQMLINLI
jgi:transcriptional regulator CtsR